MALLAPSVDVTGDSGALRAQTTTSAPASRNVPAMTLPRPLVPPVTMIDLPEKSRGSVGDREGLTDGTLPVARTHVRPGAEKAGGCCDVTDSTI